MKNIAKNLLISVLAIFIGLSSVYAQTASERSPINVNLIIDGSVSLSGVKDEINTWVSRRLDQILVNGDRVTVWSAGTQARVIYSGRIENNERETVKRSIRDISPVGNNADFSGALRDAANRQSGDGYSYTLLISASPAALTSVLSSPQANLLRFSRVEEFTSWRALVVGLNIDSKVKNAATAYFTQ